MVSVGPYQGGEPVTLPSDAVIAKRPLAQPVDVEEVFGCEPNSKGKEVLAGQRRSGRGPGFFCP